jgi:HupE / UreJ protein
MLYLTTVMHQRRDGTAAHGRSAGWNVVARVLGLGVCLAACASRLAAHEIPERVAVRAFVQREGTVLRILVRVPLEAMRDVDFPLRGDGSLDLVRVRSLLPAAAEVWISNSIAITADGRPLSAPHISGTRVALPNDRAFDTIASALAAFQAAPPETEIIQWKQLLFDVALEYTLPSATAKLVLHPNFAHLGVRTTSVLRVVGEDGTERALMYAGNPGAVALDPSLLETAAQFVRDGFQHILGGIDHLLFILCLVLPVRRWRALIAIVTAFTIAHSLTLGSAALGFAPAGLWFPPLVEVLIAASIVWLAIENVIRPAERLAERWPIAFGFGLVHGFGFSFALSERLQFAGGNLLTALAAFNIGVESGQLLILALTVPLLWLARRHVRVQGERLITIVGSVLVGHTAWHWLADRCSILAEYRSALRWPSLDASFALGAMRASLLAAVALAVGLALRQILRVPRRS